MNLLDLVAVLTLDSSGYEKGLEGAESKASSVGSAIGNGIGKIAKFTAAGLAATTTAVTALVGSSVKAYANYEQLVGGVETLFGAGGQSIEEYAKDVGKSVDEISGEYDMLQERQQTALENASKAYKTAGLSANQYMETVTSFAAALNSSLGEYAWQSANYADMAVIQMADNANKMGTSMESIQNAYMGFSKQNYTMLDNLKLGYGGTKEEMERLLRDAEKLEGYVEGAFDVSNFADIVEAIGIIQDNLGIAGTTAKEATETISGSLGMMKSAWQNVVTGLTDENANMTELIGNLVDSVVGYTDESGEHVKGFMDNIVPAVKQALDGVAQLVAGMAPILAEQLPKLLNDNLPVLLKAASELFNGLIKALPSLITTLAKQIPTIVNTTLPVLLNATTSLIVAMIDALPDMMTMLVEKLPDLLETITGAIISLLPMLMDVGAQMLLSLADAIVEALPVLIPAITNIIITIANKLTEPETLSSLILAAVDIIIALVNGLAQATPELIKAAPQIIINIVQALIQAAPQLFEAAVELMKTLAQFMLDEVGALWDAAVTLMTAFGDGIASTFDKLRENGADLVKQIGDGLKQKLEDAKKWGKDLIQNFIDGIKAKWEALKQTISNVAQSVKDFLGFSEPKKGPLSNFHTYAPDMIDLFIKGVNDNTAKLTSAVANAFDFEDLIGVNSLGAVTANGQKAYTNGSGKVYNYTINVNQPISTPDEMAQTIRTESQYGLIMGEPI